MTHMWALYAREVKRFQKLWMDTVFSPIISIALYLAVFGIVTGGEEIAGINYLTFVYTGLLAMMIVNSSFSNPTFSLIIAKNVGTMIDLQLAPIKPWKIGIAYALAACTRAILTLLIAVLLTFWLVPSLGIYSAPALLAALLLTGLEFGMLGVVFGMYAKNFEALTFMTTFVMQPMIFLASVFYPIAVLPTPWDFISEFNPIHHNVNLFRYALTGYGDVNPWISLGVVVGLCVLFFVVMQIITKKNIQGQTKW